MNRKTGYKFILVLLVVLFLFTDAAPLLPINTIETAQASAPGPNIILGLFRTLGALRRRNRLYREAGETSEDINAYYDRLLEKTRSIRRDLIAETLNKDIPDDKRKDPEIVSAYVRIEAALEAERKAAIQLIEGEKNQARRDFEKALIREITRILIASPGGQRIINNIRETIGGARETAVAVQAAVEGGKPIEALGDALAKQVGDIPILQEAARELGSSVGHKLDQALGGVFTKITGVINNIQEGMGEAISVLDDLDASVAQHDQKEKTAVSLVENDSLLGEIFPVDRANPVVDVVASAFAGATKNMGGLNPRISRKTMMDRIRGALLTDRLEGIQKLKTGESIGKIYCTSVGRGQYEAAAGQLGDQIQTANDPQNAVYLVCYDLQTQDPVYAKLTEPDPEEGDDDPTASEDEDQSEADTGCNPDFPAGDYQPTITYVKTKYVLSELLSEEVKITITEDGSVTGSVSFHIAESWLVGKDCIEQIEKQTVGSIKGQIEETKSGVYNGTFDFEGNTTTTVLESCGITTGGDLAVYGSGRINLHSCRLNYGTIDDFFKFE